MTISVNENANTESLKISDTTFKSWGLIKEGTEDLDTNIFFELEDDIQNQLYALNYNEPVSLNLSLQIELFGRLELQKLDSNGKLINGATFNVKGENFNQDVKVTNGKIIIEKLRKGTYTITEKSAPSGYLLDTKEYNVEIKVNQTTTQAVVNVQPTGTFTLVKKNADKSSNLKEAEYRIWNANYDKTFTTNVKVIKVDAKTKEIIKDKFTFAIYEDPECTKLIKEVKSNKENGFVEFADLRFGVYYIKETNEPKGYELSNRIAKVEINDKGIFVDDIQVEEQDSIITIDFENKKIETPKTGDSSHVKLAIGVAILALLGLAWLFIKIFKRN